MLGPQVSLWSNYLKRLFRGPGTGVVLPFNNHPTLSNDLVSYWTLDEQSGVRYDSVVASGNDLTDNNTVTYVNAGPSGVVANFVAANSEKLSKASVNLGLTDFTIAVWVKTTGIALTYQEYVCKNNTVDFDLRCYDANYIQFNAGGSSAQIQTDANWHLLVAYYNSAENKAYLTIDAGTPTVGAAGAGFTETSSEIAIGAATALFYNNGLISRTGIWNRIIDISERTSLYNTGTGKSYSDLTDAEKVGLVSYWNLDEVSGARYDSHGANDLTDNNTVTSVVSGPGGVVADFALASSEYLSNTSPSLVLTTAATWSFWTKFESVATDEILISKWDYQTDGEWLCQLDNGGGNKLTFYIADSAGDVGNNRVSYNAVAVTAGSWDHWVWVYDGGLSASSRIALYKNGVDVSAGLLYNGTIPATIRSGSPDLVFGTGSGTLNGRYFDGLQGRVGIWNQAFDAARVTSLYNTGIGKAYADLTTADKVGLVSYWNLTETSGNRADSHGSNTLTDNNTVTYVVNGPPPPKNIAAQFTAANSESLSHVSNASLQLPATGLAFSLWVKANGAGQTVGLITKDSAGGRDYFLGAVAGTIWMVTSAGGSNLASFGSLTDGAWIHIYAQWDPVTGKCGLSSNNAVLSESGLSVAQVTSTSAFSIGSRIGYSDLPFNGIIDEVGFWSRVLTAQERTDLFNSGNGLFYGTGA